ncbi:MAG TPA: hypothetical protein VF546_06765 [Pyrinomonadaceae bacterium]
MLGLLKFVKVALRDLPRTLSGLTIGWIRSLVEILGRKHRVARRHARWRRRRIRPGDCGAPCQVVPADVYRRPDPLIYSQTYLMAQGLAVTWDNPDIELRLNGQPADSSKLAPDTDYEIVARIWNGSTEAPAVNMPVRFSFLDFGIGGVEVPIGHTQVDLPVKGAPGHPAFAHMLWHTPVIPGHYCLRVRLVWPDDANPHNNLGQENTDVRPLNSPHAQFRVPVRNAARRRRILRLEPDAYEIPPRPPCDSNRPARETALTEAEIEGHRREARARHNRAAFPVPPAWRVEVLPAQVELEPESQQVVTVAITAPDGFHGRQAFNVNAFEGATLVGGVTLYVRG